MATPKEITKFKNVSYVNKDFEGVRNDLLKFADAHHSGVFSDKNESSSGMALIELMAYCTDIMNYNIDIVFNELMMESSRERSNTIALAKEKGMKHFNSYPATCKQTFYVQVPALNNAPNDSYCPILLKGTQVASQNGSVYETLSDLNFSGSSLDSPRQVAVSQVDSNGVPTWFAIKKDVDIVAGQTVIESFDIDTFEQFRSVTLTNIDVTEIISVVDSDGNKWYEVDFLAQETVYDAYTNVNSDSNEVPYVMRLLSVPRRFITDYDPNTGQTSLVFGSGDGINFDDEIVPNIADYAIPLAGRDVFNSYSIDPQNFTKTRTLGLSPWNTTLTVTYRVGVAGGGVATNADIGMIDTISSFTTQYAASNLDPATLGKVESYLRTLNNVAATGGAAEPSISEIKAHAAALYASQSRIVTKEDVVARIMTLPNKFGKPEKVYVKRNSASPYSIDIYVLSLNDVGQLVATTSTLKQNIATYLTPFRMLTDGINIVDASIINIRCYFSLVISQKVSKTEVIAQCLDTVRQYFSTDRRQIGQPIYVAEVQSLIQDVDGVVSVSNLEFTSVFGENNGYEYSQARKADMKPIDNIIYCPENAIFEMKYPLIDIVGVAK